MHANGHANAHTRSLGKLRRLQDLQANMSLVEKEASYLRGALEGRTREIDELLRERANLLLQVSDEQNKPNLHPGPETLALHPEP